jgi:electron transport complex protein RnfC
MKPPMEFDPQPPRPLWGIRPPTRKSASMMRPILVAPAPEQVVIPIRQCLGMSAAPMVELGQPVQTGQPIARAIHDFAGPSGPQVHASISGTIESIGAHPVPGRMGDEEICIRIRSNGLDSRYTGYDNLHDPMQLAPARICELVAAAGIVGLGGALFSTASKLSAQNDIHTLLINGAECEPYITCDEIMLREHAAEVIRGARIMMRALGASQTVIGIESDMPAARVAINDAIDAEGGTDIHTSVVTAKYPAGGERQLIQLIMGTEVPEGALPRNIGVVCHNVGTATAIADFFRDGRPLISRIVTVTGSGIHEPLNIDTRIGTIMADLFELADGRSDESSHLIMGGPMMGVSLPSDDLPVTKATNCLILMKPRDISPPRREMPCIRCGECNQVCPAQLLPQELLRASRQHDIDALDSFGLDACIECGCCDYVCPSYIPLTARFINSKVEVTEHTIEADQAIRARNRFEAREARLARQREERDADLQTQVDQAKDAESIEDIMARVKARDDQH